ncbi:hypothetical protein NEOLI_003803 [Neolecta irregularis DAH-3]|uniref:Uncharacterized protein n=1 Tax=Neolecta irregularis (strain DAH-3) TaxID=1198029 RepID=A0A1U7LU51_NEOID|nr:hypothetical protein NEOLI_003803 [Neolecta irregularis DAH-3]|eukprot:OLL26205.1 hypothetical protein NEOLI_003803 [Neolecta irregularis DAH-3]
MMIYLVFLLVAVVSASPVRGLPYGTDEVGSSDSTHQYTQSSIPSQSDGAPIPNLQLVAAERTTERRPLIPPNHSHHVGNGNVGHVNQAIVAGTEPKAKVEINDPQDMASVDFHPPKMVTEEKSLSDKILGVLGQPSSVMRLVFGNN